MNPTPRSRPFHQVDVFASQPYRGNPLAVVLDAQGLDAAAMQHFANWTNLSETTFLLPPEDPRADYKVRIFTGSEEFPFAGHPTLGSAHTWLEAGGVPKADGYVVQECAAGLVRVRLDGGRLAFAAPPLTRFGPVEAPVRRQLAAALRLRVDDVLDAAWLVNGPEWIGVLLGSAEQVLALEPDQAAMGDLKVGVIGPHAPGAGTDFEVRTFLPGDAMVEDPVTGSFNAGAAQWLIGSGRAPEQYLASQGTVLGRAGRIHVGAGDGEIWVGGDSTTCIKGSVLL
ncbi:PhzF family phenazine biosynthesis protein [Arthrobacter sp. FW306-05-C]|uniref:PhzF family phenazine biosynthesis protein n=1 Tax=Arthrobacter TaxID=1663 RepID=UPI001EF0D154|nr:MULTISPECIES: PhzF family phenazine biosynthesis protein [Arthrobacter]MDP9985729.1 PhzF family phenazine biosynthesis protein [Arthrobacter oryzae]UKA66825.1 PhzF family phenazine biosynthesis protein [Arthrobacter sp. FW306-05-C]UKA71141.1 PhzF family phenazine biosynthesis protein [Arthrobacter sp. FW306-06-A]